MKLVDLVNRFAEMYCSTKDIKTVRRACLYPSSDSGRSAPVKGLAGGSDQRDRGGSAGA